MKAKKNANVRTIGSRRHRTSTDIVACAQPLSPGRRRRRPSVEVWGVCEKTPLPRDTRRRMGVDVVGRVHALSPARMRTSSPGRKRRRPSVEVWGVGEKTPLPRGTYRCTGADIVARAHAYVVARTQALSPGRRRRRRSAVFVKKHPSHVPPVVARAQTLSPVRMSCHPRACVLARAYTLLPERGRFSQAPTALVARRCRRAGVGVVTRAGLVCAGTSEGIKGPGSPSLLTFLPSEASWPRPALQQLLARTSRIGFFLLCYLFM